MEIILNLRVREVNEAELNIDTADECLFMELIVPENFDFNILLSDENIKRVINSELISLKKYDFTEEDVEMTEKLLASDVDIASLITEINIEPDRKTANYLKNNPIILNYPLFLEGYFLVSNEDLAKIDDYFKTLDFIKVRVDGNEKPVSIKKYINTINAINEIVDQIKKYNLSPIEQTMYAYDLVRERVYTAENPNEDISVSRDLSSVLFGDKIVCVGFANILDKVLKNLQIKSEMIRFSCQGEMHGHRRNIIYIKDEKYDIEAVYYIDPTFDCKRNENDKSYLDSYRYFCRTQDEIKILDKNAKNNLINDTFENFTYDIVEKVKVIFDAGEPNKIPNDIRRAINCVAKFVDDEELISLLAFYKEIDIPDIIRGNTDLNDIIEKLKRYKSIVYDNSLTSKQLLQVLLKVRMVEYIEEPEKYFYDLEALKRVAVLNESELISSTDRVFYAIFGYSPAQRKMASSEFNGILEEEKFEESKAKAELVKTLKDVYRKKCRL